MTTAFDDADGLDVADRLRHHADALENLAWILRDQAHLMQPNEDGRVLSYLTVWENARVRTWISDQIVTPEQEDWLARRYDEAKSTIPKS